MSTPEKESKHEPEQGRECKPTPPSDRPDPLSERPAPCPGQKWRFGHMQETAEKTFERVQAGDECFCKADDSGDWFKVLIGNYPPIPDDPKTRSRIPALSNLGLYFWYIPPWYNDTQTPHKEDEAYFVVDGCGELSVSGRKQKVSKGDLLFVPRSVPHRFFTPFGKGLTLLIIFSPAYTGGPDPCPLPDPTGGPDPCPLPDPKDEDDRCCSKAPCRDTEPEEEDKSKARCCPPSPCRDRDYEAESRKRIDKWVAAYRKKSAGS